MTDRLALLTTGGPGRTTRGQELRSLCSGRVSFRRMPGLYGIAGTGPPGAVRGGAESTPRVDLGRMGQHLYAVDSLPEGPRSGERRSQADSVAIWRRHHARQEPSREYARELAHACAALEAERVEEGVLTESLLTESWDQDYGRWKLNVRLNQEVCTK